jgi:transcriptional repressor NrdR
VRCPSCGERDTRVVDSRDLDDAAIRRRRECATCGSRFTTYERIESARLTVLKSDGRREEFDRDKLANGLAKALTRRPVPSGAAMAAADSIEAQLRAQGVTEVPSTAIGELAMDRLRTLDQIAYVRFASVYQSFDDLEQLKREVDTLIAERADEAPGQTSMGLVAPSKRISGAVIGAAPAGSRNGGPARRPARRS